MMLATTRSLSDWLDRIERLHSAPIELGLERISQVRERMQLRTDFPVILVGGTNGKGSTCAFLEAIYRGAGYLTGLYTSPHILARTCANAMRSRPGEALTRATS